MQFFPKELEFQDLRSPLQILEQANLDWLEGSEGRLRLEITIDNHNLDVSFCLATVEDSIHVPLLSVTRDYPVKIMSLMEPIPTWISKDSIESSWNATPSELSKSLEVFMDSTEVKTAIINLLIEMQDEKP